MSKLPGGGFNRLRNEKSPYLLQHAGNPVDWYPWGEEAFAKAGREDKPVFLSIGYSTCHWCHVMAHESFEDTEVADLMNREVVAIKVDREERPDLDAVYMKACHLLSGSGGWPLNILLTPDKRPFFAATYIPKSSRMGRLGMMELIPAITRFWKTNRGEVDDVSSKLTEALSAMESDRPGGTLSPSVFQKAYEELGAEYDSACGGFSHAPKFPMPHTILFLLRYWHRTGEREALRMARNTLEQMARGGVYDQVGFGFHRYSTDRTWLVPHFEKMLYDQALLAMAYVEGYQATGEAAFARTAREILTYCLRDMAGLEGGFHSGEDADSEGEEGKYYLWGKNEVFAVLGEEDGTFAARVFNVREEGNFLDESTGRLIRKNILHLEAGPSTIAEKLDMTPEAFDRRLAQVRERLFDFRKTRVRPFKDDKVLTDWNGLTIAALAKAARVLDEPSYLEAAARSADFILGAMQKDGGLLHRYRDGESAIPGSLEDYAFFVWGLLELYEAGFDGRFLRKAVELNTVMIDRFWDEGTGGFFLTPAGGEELFVRPKEVYDGAIPSGNSVALGNLAKLYRLTGDPSLAEKAVQIASVFSSAVEQRPSSFCQFLCGWMLAVGPVYETVIVHREPAVPTEMLGRIRRIYSPNNILQVKKENEPVPGFSLPLKCLDGMPTAYVCKDSACGAPTHDVEIMAAMLR